MYGTKTLTSEENQNDLSDSMRTVGDEAL